MGGTAHVFLRARWERSVVRFLARPRITRGAAESPRDCAARGDSVTLRQHSPRNRQAVSARAEQIERPSVGTHVLARDLGEYRGSSFSAVAGGAARATAPGALSVEV